MPLLYSVTQQAARRPVYPTWIRSRRIVVFCVGLDYWGDDCEYSLSQAEHNAELEGVQGLQFLKGSASRLPFADGDFRRVVSCLTFHEVRDVADTTVSIAEALRVLDLDGRFAFIDLFDDPGFYEGREQVLKVIESAGGKIESTASLSKLLDLRFPLTLGKVLKYAVLVSGIKTLVMEQRDMPLAR